MQIRAERVSTPLHIDYGWKWRPARTHIQQTQYILLRVWDICNLMNGIRWVDRRSPKFIDYFLARLFHSYSNFGNIKTYSKHSQVTDRFGNSYAIFEAEFTSTPLLFSFSTRTCFLFTLAFASGSVKGSDTIWDFDAQVEFPHESSTIPTSDLSLTPLPHGWRTLLTLSKWLTNTPSRKVLGSPSHSTKSPCLFLSHTLARST